MGSKLCLRATLAALLACGLLLAAVSPRAFAAAIDLGSVNQKIGETQNKLSSVKKQESSALKKLTKTQMELQKTQANLDRLNAQLKGSQARYSQTVALLLQAERELANIENKLEGVRTVFRGRMRAIYLYGPMTYLEMLLTARDFSDFVSRFEFLSFLLERDAANIREYEEAHAELEQKKREIEQRKKDIQLEKERVERLQRQTSAERAKVASKYRQTQIDLNRIQQNRQELERVLDELERMSRALEADIRKRGDSQQLGTGSFIWPVKARITSQFGWRTHPILRSKKFHSGLDLAVPTGTSVLAADSGVVLTAGWINGYGYTVIIDHGAGYSSLYGHNSKVLVKQGSRVVQGQVVSKSGSTGYSTGPHLHFEIRKDGAPVNPLSYVH